MERDKRKTEIMILIIIIIVGVNYSLYRYYFIPKHNEVKRIKQEYETKSEKLREAKILQGKVSNIKKETEQLKKNIKSLDDLTSNQIDTPQLIYDLYNSCTKYGINGDEVKFQLILPKAANEQETSSNAESTSSDTHLSDDVIRLSIDLKVNGDKYKIEKYIKNLNNITTRKLNVKSINLLATEQQNLQEINYTKEDIVDSENLNTNVEKTQPNGTEGEANKQETQSNVAEDEVNQEGVQINGTEEQTNKSTIVVDDNILAEIVFYQYIKVDKEKYEKIKNYSFYDKKIGFKSIAEMFKK
ncbi:hypothetical protein ACFIJ5_15205 [Haloimpatiens sp. FM7330]|uniref:hypothetical protein n=1 Tax=Haloimpatiens sp. FM7330 TaxID=3298610 RepID=UPI00362F7E2C